MTLRSFQDLALRNFPGRRFICRLLYAGAQNAVVRLAGKNVKAVYLRIDGRELHYGADTLNFFFVLGTVPAEQEMVFLKNFWAGYRRLRRFFPFLGEVGMGDENELQNWRKCAPTGARLAAAHWQLIRGTNLLPFPRPADAQDVFSEAVKLYWNLLEPVMKLRDEQFREGLSPRDSGALHLRNAAIAALELFRLHHATKHPGDESIWRASAEELIGLLPEEYNAKAFRNIIRLAPPFFANPVTLYAELLRRACLCLDELARSLPTGANWKMEPARGLEKDSAALSVRELFAEQMLFTHGDFFSRAVLAEQTTHIYFIFSQIPGPADFLQIVQDLREVSFAYDRFSAAMPLSAAAFRELERGAALDAPFYSLGSHTEIENKDGEFVSRPYHNPEAQLPSAALQKLFAELTFSLRLQPLDLPHFLGRMLTLVLGIRLGTEENVFSTDFSATLNRYSEKFPRRAEHLRAQILPYLFPTEEEIWPDIFARLSQYQNEVPGRAHSLRGQLEAVRFANRQRRESKTTATDAWTNLTPFLRMEMNSLKDVFFQDRPALKI